MIDNKYYRLANIPKSHIVYHCPNFPPNSQHCDLVLLSLEARQNLEIQYEFGQYVVTLWGSNFDCVKERIKTPNYSEAIELAVQIGIRAWVQRDLLLQKYR